MRAPADRMSVALTQDEAQLELQELEIEEDRIIRELREMDEKVHSATVARTRFDPSQNPRHTLNSLLLECEQEVRDVKGYISSPGPPLQIARCRRGDTVPTHATFLSRPKGTGVDFTVPVTLKEYNSAVKNPIFLNTIRDKCKANAYSSAEEYISDMKLLHRNTAAFIKGQDLQWVVQHAKLLLEGAIDAVECRRRQIDDASASIPRSGGSARQPLGKRKRSSSGSTDVNGAHAQLSVGTTIQVYWEDDRKWHTGTIRDMGAGNQVQIDYNNDSNGGEWLDLQHEAKWRLPTSGRSKRIADNNNKRKKSVPTPTAPPQTRGASSSAVAVAVNPDSATKQDLVAMREELLSAMEENKISVLNHINDRFVRIDTKLARSDPLHRVLIAVSDMQQVMQAKVAETDEKIMSVQKSIQELQVSVSKLVEKALSSVAGPGSEPDVIEKQLSAGDEGDSPVRDEENRREQVEAAPKDVEPEAPALEIDVDDADPKHKEIDRAPDEDEKMNENVSSSEGEGSETNVENLEPGTDKLSGKLRESSVDEPSQSTLPGIPEKPAHDVAVEADEIDHVKAKPVSEGKPDAANVSQSATVKSPEPNDKHNEDEEPKRTVNENGFIDHGNGDKAQLGPTETVEKARPDPMETVDKDGKDNNDNKDDKDDKDDDDSDDSDDDEDDSDDEDDQDDKVDNVDQVDQVDQVDKDGKDD